MRRLADDFSEEQELPTAERQADAARPINDTRRAPCSTACQRDVPSPMQRNLPAKRRAKHVWQGYFPATRCKSYFVCS